mmetsp:Transcript_14811/g.29067  ORF Transcript_14811/g.29067 Transcript_14811/m.29067 type:complete len:209 (-) Transcript_14811:575-1201(-)
MVTLGSARSPKNSSSAKKLSPFARAVCALLNAFRVPALCVSVSNSSRSFSLAARVCTLPTRHGATRTLWPARRASNSRAIATGTPSEGVLTSMVWYKTFRRLRAGPSSSSTRARTTPPASTPARNSGRRSLKSSARETTFRSSMLPTKALPLETSTTMHPPSACLRVSASRCWSLSRTRRTSGSTASVRAASTSLPRRPSPRRTSPRT